MGCGTSTRIGTLAPFDVADGMPSTGRWSRSCVSDSAPHTRRIAGSASRPAAVEARPRKPRLDTAGRHGGASKSIIAASEASVPTGVELAALVRPDDVGLERLHGLRVVGELLAFVRLLDAPVDHVPERGELVHLLLELRELVRMGVRRERVAHGAGHPGLRQLSVQLLLR